MKWTVLLLLVCFAGCTGSDEPAKPVAATHSSEKSKSPSVVSPNGSDAASPALQASPIVPVDASPEEVVSAALSAWQAGNEPKFKALLTPTAQVETAKLGFVMESLPPAMKFEVKSTEYVTEKKYGAHVHFTWTEPLASGEEYSMDGFWLLKHEKPFGWRISGMANQLESEPEQFETFNFEDAVELAKKLDFHLNQDDHPKTAKGKGSEEVHQH